MPTHKTDPMIEASSAVEGGAEVLRFAPRGKGAEVAALFERQRAGLVQFLAIRLGSVGEAEEAAQEAFVRLLQSQSAGGPENLKALLYVTARNISTDRLRRRTREQAYEREHLSTKSEVPSPEEILAGREGIKRVAELMEELPPKCRDAFSFYKLHAMEYGEIAFRMGLTESMVRKYVLRALAHLARGLGREEAP